MGICSSCQSTHVATAKLILHDGKLQEFPYPVKASHVLQKLPASFICNADEMEFDGVLSAISADEDLQIGQLYFALPLKKLRRPLPPEEMAALAVKASAALMRSNGCSEKCGCRRNMVSPVGFGGRSKRVAAVGGGGGRLRRGGGGGGSRKFTAVLSAIPE